MENEEDESAALAEINDSPQVNIKNEAEEDAYLPEANEEKACLVTAETEIDSKSKTFYYEPPYTAPLAPIVDVEIARRASKAFGVRKRYSKRSGDFKPADFMDSNMFINSEKEATQEINNKAGRDAAAAELNCESYNLGNGKNTYQNDKSDLNNSTASTLLLSDNNSEEAVLNSNTSTNRNANQQHHLNSTDSTYQTAAKLLNQYKLPLKTPLVPMTEISDDASVEKNLDYQISECSCPREFYQRSEINYSLFFDDGIRSIDFVLAYKVHPQPQVEAGNTEKRRIYEENLVNQGLEIERVFKEKEQIYFVKIHAPLEVLRRYTEILKLRMPMKELICDVSLSERSNRLHHAAHFLSKKIPGMSAVNRSTRSVFASLKGIFSFFMRNIYTDEKNFPKITHRFTAIYSRDKEYLFDITQECFFTTAVRSRIVQFILDRQRYPTKYKDEMAFGIERLVADNVYCAAYPLHDGEITEKGTMREKLYTHWASINKWYRYQPLDYVKEYFGVKIGLYFAWLGYYTYMLLLASVIGIICFIYSLVSLRNYIPVKDICDRDGNASITMCPLCDWCNFWDLKETCFYAKITYLIDNPSTVFFAIFMSFWAALFLELWKRYSAEITHRWDLTGFDVHEEHPRPQYLARLQHIPPTRTDYVTNIKEPKVPFWRMKLPATVFSFSVVLLLIALAFAALVAVVIYRVSMLGILKVGHSSMPTSSAIMLATASAAFVNLCLLYILNYMYNYLAEYLTELEMWRTQTQFDDSLTLKIYLLQFVNYYASIFYIAFFKGKFVGHPGAYNKFFDYRQEECSSGGCLTELCIQLAIIMIGKQALNSILEVIMPLFWRKVLAIKVGLTRLFKTKEDKPKEKVERWLRDLKLLDWGPRSLFPEYLEMVLQYGFVTIFVAAFPLAPIFALFNNILEMRLDAKKLLTHHKRPVSQRVRDIGVWYRILDCIGKLSVITNGFIIAFTSDFIPRLVYRTIISPDKSLRGYINFTLSEFNINDSPTLYSLAGDKTNITMCMYSDYREGPKSFHKYDLSGMFYIILACRLGFVVLFENVVALVMILVRWCIPDMSVELRDQIRREIYITNEIIIEQEASRAQFERSLRRSSMNSENRGDSASTNTQVQSNEKFIKIEKLLNGHLSQSEMDLIIHGTNTQTGIAGAADANSERNLT